MLDATPIIEAFTLDVWDALMQSYRIRVPSTVVHDEALFYSQEEQGVPKPIRLPDLVTEGRLDELSATPMEIKTVTEHFDFVMRGNLHAGELEALALLFHSHARGSPMCTGDGAAIRALAMLGMADQGISMQRALEDIGIKRPLPRRHTEEFFQARLQEGQEDRITGRGLLRRPGLD